MTFAALFSTIHSYSRFFLEHLNSTFATTLSCTLLGAWNYYVNYQMTQTGSRTTVTSKLELFVTILTDSLTIVTKISILDVAGVLDPTLIIDIFALQNWILISLKPIFHLDGFRLFTFLDNVRMRQFLSGKKLEIYITTKVERKETWRVFVKDSERNEC